MPIELHCCLHASTGLSGDKCLCKQQLLTVRAHLRAAGAMVCIAFVHNLLRRHPATCVLLHRPVPRLPPPEQASASGAGPSEKDAAAAGNGAATSGDGQARSAAALGQDPYLADEEDPAESRAIESSLWEMDSLRNHYAPQARSMWWRLLRMQDVLRLCRSHVESQWMLQVLAASDASRACAGGGCSDGPGSRLGRSQTHRRGGHGTAARRLLLITGH